jgi:hypothetical protein
MLSEFEDFIQSLKQGDFISRLTIRRRVYTEGYAEILFW